MNEDQLIQALTKIVDRKMLQEIRETVVFKNEDDNYELYGKYIISHEGEDFKISTSSSDTLGIFSNIKSAVTYVTYDLRCMIYESNRVQELDSKLTGLEVAIKIHEKLYKKSKDAENKLIYLCKLQEDRLKKKATLDELNRYIRTSYDWQIRKFTRQAAKTNQSR